MNRQMIKDKLSLLPLQPGCYLMKDKDNTVIYVGKAKKLKNRVSSYFVGAHNYKTTKLVQEIVDFDYIVTDSEKEALLLEINLIKDYSPKYNISFMDNKYYPYIQLTKEKHPRLKIVRNAQDKKHKHFGPFPDGTAARETFKLLNRLYPLRKCNHIPKKPCLYYSLNQCVAPCIQEVSDEVYKEMTSSITKFIQGDTKEIINDLQNKMMSASEVQNYELAKECRDLITHIQHVTSKQHVQFNDLVDRDIVGYYSDKGYLCLQLFFMRNGKLLARDLNLVPAQDDYQEQIISFLVQFYQENTEPKELLVPQELDIELLKENLKKKGYKLTPQRRAIVDVIIEKEGEHLTAEEIYDEVKKVCPDIGLATVYRTVLLLEEVGVIFKLDLNDGCSRYELVHEDEEHRHHHLICNKCKKVIEVQDDLLEELEERIRNTYGFDILDHSVKFFGICSECKNKKEK